MNIQKSRLVAIISVMLIVCMMTVMLVVPASAATTVTAYTATVSPCELNAYILEIWSADLQGYENYLSLALALGIEDGRQAMALCSENKDSIYIPHSIFDDLKELYDKTFNADIEIVTPRNYYQNENGYVYFKFPANITIYNKTVSRELTYCMESAFANAISSDGISGVFDQILSLLPIVIPVFIGFIGLDKAIKFLIGVLRGA